MTGLERNSDIVIMASYAPLFVNVSDLTPRVGSMQWPTDLIGYDALGSYGSPAFYAQVMFNNNRGDQILEATAEHVGSRTWQPPAPRGGGDRAAGARGADLVLFRHPRQQDRHPLPEGGQPAWVRPGGDRADPGRRRGRRRAASRWC